MKCRANVTVLAAVALIGVLSSGDANAALVITNGGFDTDADNFAATVAPWTRDAGGGVLIDLTAFSSSGGPATATSGNFVAAVNNDAVGATTYSQVLSGTMDANTLYTITFDLAAANGSGLAADLSDLSDHHVTLSVNGSVDGLIASQDMAQSLTAKFAWETGLPLNFSSGGLDLGQAITISVAGTYTGAGAGQQFWVDTFAISGVPVPEPSSLALLGLGGLALLRRRRK